MSCVLLFLDAIGDGRLEALHPQEDARVIAAFYTATEKLDEAGLHDYVNERLARYKQPRAFVHLPALPTGANGKLLRRALRDEFRKKTDD